MQKLSIESEVTFIRKKLTVTAVILIVITVIFTVLYKNANNFLPNTIPEPDKIIFYSDGKAQILTDTLKKEVAGEFNKSVFTYRWSILRLCVTEDIVADMKENFYCVEFHYEKEQTLKNLYETFFINKIGPYTFDKMIICLNGERENVVFFQKNGEYRNGPIESYKSDLSENILEKISIKNEVKT